MDDENQSWSRAELDSQPVFREIPGGHLVLFSSAQFCSPMAMDKSYLVNENYGI